MTPARMTELACPKCEAIHWEYDSDFRDMVEEFVAYSERDYRCPVCHYAGTGYTVLRQSPSFFLEPHPLYPIAENDRAYWLEIFETNFPERAAARSARKRGRQQI
jgi:hypothetical protein